MAAFQHDHAATKPRALGSITLKAQCGPVAALLCVLSSGGSHITPLSRNPDAEHPLAWSIQNATLFTYPHHQARKGRTGWVRGMSAAESSDLPKYHSLPPMSLCVGHTYFSHAGRPYCHMSLSLHQWFPVYFFRNPDHQVSSTEHVSFQVEWTIGSTLGDLLTGWFYVIAGLLQHPQTYSATATYLCVFPHMA